MTNEELKIWFLDKYNSCYPVNHYNFKDNIIFMMYDINYIRSKKLANILNKEVEYPTEVNGDCLFSLNLEYNIFNIDYDIWSYIESNYNSCDIDVISFIGYLTNDCNLNKFSPAPRNNMNSPFINDQKNILPKIAYFNKNMKEYAGFSFYE